MKKKYFNKQDVITSLVFLIGGIISGIVLALYQYNMIPQELLQGMSKIQFAIISGIQVGVIYGLILGFLGLKLARATNFNEGFLGFINGEKSEKYKIASKSVILAISFGFINATLMVVSEKFVFANFIPEIKDTVFKFDPLYLLGGLTYGGIIEEIMMRLFVMSLIVFILYKVFAKTKEKEEIPALFYWIAIVLAGLLFAVGHLPAAFSMMAVTPIVIVRIILMNFIPGVLFGYLYWKKGLEYAMIAHGFSHIFTQLLWLPILF